MLSTIEKRQERANLWEQAKALHARAEGEKRALLAEEDKHFDDLMKRVDELGAQVQREERMSRVSAELAAPIVPITATHEVTHGRGGGAPTSPEQLERLKQVRSFILGPTGQMEFRALQADSLTAGGATFQREQFVATLIKFVDDMVHMRRFATVVPVTSSDSLGIPTLDTDVSDADWTSELDTGTEDSSMAFGKRSMTVHPLAKRIKISNKLLTVSALNPEALVASRLAYKFAITEEKAFLTGTGVQQPLGVFIADTKGIGTTRDIVSTAAADIKADDLISTKYNCKQQYMAKGAWMMHRDTVAKVRKLKDGNGQYLWAPGAFSEPSLAAGQADTILGNPLMMSEYAPNTYATGKYVIVFGDFSFYWIAELISMQLQKLVELYAATNQVGYIARTEIDAAPVLAEAFSRLKLL